MLEYYRLNLLQIPARHGDCAHSRRRGDGGGKTPAMPIREGEDEEGGGSKSSRGRRKQTCILDAAAVIPAGWILHRSSRCGSAPASADTRQSGLTARSRFNPPLKQSVRISEWPLLERSPPLPFVLHGSAAPK